MAKRKCKNVSTDREKWNNIFNALVHMLQTQQTQLQSLANERKLLEDRFKFLHERWASDVNLFRDHISQLQRDFTVKEMEQMVGAAKADLFISLKQTQASMYKHKSEMTEGDLSDFTEWFDCLARKLSDYDNVPENGKNKEEEHPIKVLQSELKRLKYENEKLSLEKNSEVSALVAEKTFLWKQYNEMESNLKENLQDKKAEVALANKKIQTLLTNMEELHSSITEKDNEEILKLKSELAKLESDSIKKDEKISQLSWELAMLRKSTGNSTTPVLRRCSSGRGRKSVMDGKVLVKKESDTKHSEKGCRRSTRKTVEVITIEDTPKLFTSSFKVPKLKRTSPSVAV